MYGFANKLVCVSATIIDEIKRIIKTSEIIKYDFHTLYECV